LNILFLGPKRQKQIEIVNFLKKDGHRIFWTSKRLNVSDIQNFDFLFSFGYRYLLNKEILDFFKNKAINFHISYLPWNKGADPNLWSILEDTPKGVTIHQMDYDLDTGKILYQEQILFDDEDTLKSSYEKLETELVEIFKKNWHKIKNGKVIPKKQKGEGSFHKSSDKKSYQKLLINGWDTKIQDLIGKAINV